MDGIIGHEHTSRPTLCFHVLAQPHLLLNLLALDVSCICLACGSSAALACIKHVRAVLRYTCQAACFKRVLLLQSPDGSSRTEPFRKQGCICKYRLSIVTHLAPRMLGDRSDSRYSQSLHKHFRLFHSTTLHCESNAISCGTNHGTGKIAKTWSGCKDGQRCLPTDARFSTWCLTTCGLFNCKAGGTEFPGFPKSSVCVSCRAVNVQHCLKHDKFHHKGE